MLDVLRRRKVDGDGGVVENVLLPPAAAAAAAAAAVHHARLWEGGTSFSLISRSGLQMALLLKSLVTGPSFPGCENVAEVVKEQYTQNSRNLERKFRQAIQGDQSP